MQDLINNNLSKLVTTIGKINLDGNIIPHQWYQKITFSSGKPDLPAIVILAEIIYWYQPKKYNDKNGNTILRKQFSGDMFQCNAAYYENKFGFTKTQARRALVRLESLGLIKRELRTVTINGITQNNTTFVEPIPEAILAITNLDSSKYKETAQLVSNKVYSQDQYTNTTNTNNTVVVNTDKKIIKKKIVKVNNNKKRQLFFPTKLTEKEKEDIEKQISLLPEGLDQQVLDVIESMIRSKQIRTNPVAVLRGIIRKYQLSPSNFDPSPGFHIAENRFQQQKIQNYIANITNYTNKVKVITNKICINKPKPEGLKRLIEISQQILN